MRGRYVFRVEAWWVLEDFFETEVSRIRNSVDRDMMVNLDELRWGFTRWARQIWMVHNELKVELSKKLKLLLDADRDEETLGDLLDTKIKLNWEMEKDEVY